MTEIKRRKRDVRQILGWFCLSLALLALLFPVFTRKAPETPTAAYAARHREAVTATVEPMGGVNVNTADMQTLCTLPGVGEVLAQRILDTRNECGGFAYPEDLLLVKGIGTKKLEALRPLICFK
mgnify:FL=1